MCYTKFQYAWSRKSKATILLAVSLFPLAANGQLTAPKGLMTDLLEHTECVFQNGLLSTIQLEEARRHPNTQVAYIHSDTPHFSWRIESQVDHTLQTAYQIQVATRPELLKKGEPDLWDSGKISERVNTAIAYNGKSLKPNTCYYWHVRVWEQNDSVSPYSAVKKFHTAERFSPTLPRYPLMKEDEKPKSITRLSDGYFVDFGNATFGQLEVTLYAQKSNDTITLHLGEAQSNGQVNRKPGGSVRYTNYRLPLRQGLHTYKLNIRPDGRNTNPNANESGVKPILMPDYIGEVYPFRYCEIEHYNGLLQKLHITRQSVTYPFDEGAAWFSSNDTVLNQVWNLCKHSIKATSFCGVYVDGDRERIPYEADAYINQLAHYGTDLEFSMARYTVDYHIEWPTWPTEWIMQSILMLWNDYMYTGDTLLLQRHYPALHARTLSALADSTGLISTRTGKQTPEFLKSIGFRGKAIRDIVDWPQSGALGIEKIEAGEADGYDLSTYNTVVNAYHYRTLVLMAEISRTLTKTEEALRYEQQAATFLENFNKLLFDPEKGAYRDGPESRHYSLHASMFPLAFGIVPEKQKERVSNYIQSRGMACSVYGSQFLMDALYEAGMDDYAMSLLCSTGLRSWYNMIRLGSTVALEAWDPKFKPNLDWNHAWGAAPANIIPRYVIGLQPLEAGFRKMRIQPHPGSLEFASAIIPTIQGDVRITYDNKSKEVFELHAVIPANCEAEVWMPRYGKGHTLTLNGKRTRAKVQDNYLVITLGSGACHLISR